MADVLISAPEAAFVDIGADPDACLTWGKGESALRLKIALPHDPALVKPRADFARQFAQDGSVFPAGLTWSVLKGGAGRFAVLGVGGLEPLGTRRYGAWAYMSDLTPRQWMFAASAAWFVLKWSWRRGATIQAVPAPTPQAVRLLKRIGFVDVGEAYMVWEG
jgi:hypothetical protein